MKKSLSILGRTFNNVAGIKAFGTDNAVNKYELVSEGKKHLYFYDYDGTVVESFTTAEALALTSLPENPSHSGLIAQGWNWSLTNIKSYLTNHPDADVNVGQMYITDDGKTRIYITLDDPDALSPYLAIAVDGEVSVDWGDGSTPDTMTGSSDSSITRCQHVYNNVGDYIIAIEVISGQFSFYTRGSNYSSCLVVGNSANNRDRSKLYSKAITKVNIGSNANIKNTAFNCCCSLLSITIPDGVTSIGSNAFQNCYSLLSVTIPDSVTSIGSNVFGNCYSLQSVTIPDSVTSIGSSAFSSCYDMESITIPDGVTSIGASAFNNCHSLSTITIPDGVTSISAGVFTGCYSLSSITIPDSVTSIGGDVFLTCYSLLSVTVPDGVTSIGSNAFNCCYSLSSITIPDGVTSINTNAFNNCYSLQSATIPDSVTSIGSGAFLGCCSLSSITIPDSVTSIDSNAFNSCYGMLDYHFKSTTPPTLASTNAFANIVSDTIIYVPYSSDHSILEAYKTATNWSTYASKMQEEPQE